MKINTQALIDRTKVRHQNNDRRTMIDDSYTSRRSD